MSIKNESRNAYVDKVISLINIKRIRPLNIVVNCSNGTAGPTFDAIAKKLINAQPSFKFTRIFHNGDSSFPNGVLNPLIEENQAPTMEKVISECDRSRNRI